MATSAWQIKGQMSIFDFMAQETEYAIQPSEETIALIRGRIDFNLSKVHNDYFDYDEWEYRKGKCLINVHFSNYSCDQMDGRKKGDTFISVNMEEPLAGAGIPCESIEKAVKWLNKFKKRIDELSMQKAKRKTL